ncbi:hypothetical protein F4604DRAFT_1931306 [Suillus subluteus]|nr:hypothetical protein F4604DRAFT_1931306 [Suillus subluteus]
MPSPSSARIPRDAKKKALENAVWNHWQSKGGRGKLPAAKKTMAKDTATLKDCPPKANLKAAKKITGQPTQKMKPTATMSQAKSSCKQQHTMTPQDSDSEDLECSDELEDIFIRKKAQLLQRDADTASDSDGKDSVDGIDSDAILPNIEETPEAVAKLLPDEVPFAPSQYRKQQLAHDRKQVAETPTWADQVESREASDASEQTSEPESMADSHAESKSHSQSTAHLVVTEGGNVKLLDQNLDTQRVVKGAIVEVKCRLLFIDGFPELVDKHQLSHQSLLIVATQRELHEIEKHLHMDNNYISQLASLVDAHIPILWRELKDDACAKVSSYFHLGHIDIEKAKSLMVQHAYIYAHNVPSPIWNKPYQGELLIALIFHLFMAG